MSNPLVSIIMPVHNRFDLAQEAILSVGAQSYRPLELILVDDHSDVPFTPKIKSDPSFSVVLIRHSVNQGPGASRETGLQAATGDYIAYCDSDDFWHEDKIAKQIAILNANPDAGMCYCQSAEMLTLPIPKNSKLRKRSDIKYTTFLPTILYGRPWDTSACIWTRDASDRIGPWFPGWAWEDYEYDCRAGCHDIRICHLPETLCFYRIKEGEEDLSHFEYRPKVTQKTQSLLAMKDNLRLFDKFSDREIRDTFFDILYRHAMHLFYLGEKKDGIELLAEIRSMAGFGGKAFCSFCLFADTVLSAKTLGHLLYKFRNVI
ncbi:glycosyltransferase [bacterium]|nr:glycosyltransferase [bacterium]